MVHSDPTYPWYIQISRYATTTNNIISFLATFPFLIALCATDWMNHDTLFMNICRILQLLKLLNLVRGRRAFVVLYRTFFATYKTFLFMFWCIVMVVVISGSLMALMERGTFTVNSTYPNGAFLRDSVDGVDREVSPFRSVNVALYWYVCIYSTIFYCM